MKSLTIAYVTSRKESKIEWFAQSLVRQLPHARAVQIIVIDHFADETGRRPPIANAFLDAGLMGVNFKHRTGKPSVWKGPNRLTREDWWSKSNDLNTAICLCETDWIAFVDDRSVLSPSWLNSVYEAMEGNYAVCGSYEKRANLVVENGLAVGGEILGEDTRRPGLYDFDSWYGGSGALPLEWCLAVNGASEDMCDGLGSEDSQFGTTLLNSGYPLKYDSRMRIIEDRTPGQIDGALKRADKNSHLGQRAKSWDIVRCFRDKTTSQNSFDIRNLRARVLSGEPFPPPSASDRDWYDGQPIAEME